MEAWRGREQKTCNSLHQCPTLARKTDSGHRPHEPRRLTECSNPQNPRLDTGNNQNRQPPSTVGARASTCKDCGFQAKPGSWLTAGQALSGKIFPKSSWADKVRVKGVRPPGNSPGCLSWMGPAHARISWERSSGDKVQEGSLSRREPLKGEIKGNELHWAAAGAPELQSPLKEQRLQAPSCSGLRSEV